MQDAHKGVWPVMLTPFLKEGRIDWAGVDSLTDWYIGHGVAGLFSVCLSSEMFSLSEPERLQLAKRVVDRTRGRVPVVASGTLGGSIADQASFSLKMAGTGVAAVVLVTNQFAGPDESDDIWRTRVSEYMTLTGDLPLGLYECPVPFHRHLTPELLGWAAASGRFIWMKDTCCRSSLQRPKIAACRGTPMHWYNAHAPSVLDSLEAGGDGYSGIAANLYPDLYVWLCANYASRPAEARELQRFLTLADMAVRNRYPVSAKLFLNRFCGVPIDETCRIPVASADGSDDEDRILVHLDGSVKAWRERLGLPTRG